jgi:hypothetical protein
VTELAAWLARRKPEPPPDLGAMLVDDVSNGSVAQVLTEVGLERLDEARARPGRVRESAFRLLEADALLTYACEAALESDDPEAELRRILRMIGG